MKPPVTLSVTELSETNIESLALQIAEQQKKEVGTTYGYCSKCGLAVSASTLWKSKKTGKLPRCNKCKDRRPSTDKTVYLCSICRSILTGQAKRTARNAAKKSHAATCGDESCKQQALLIRSHAQVKSIPCRECGDPATGPSSTHARAGNSRPYCNKITCQSRALLAKKNSVIGTKRCGASSTFIGVTNSKRDGWVAKLYHGLHIHVGVFATELEAAQAYDITACDILGKNAKLNFGVPGYI